MYLIALVDTSLSTSANSAYEVTAIIRTQKLKEETRGQSRLTDGSLIDSGENQLEHIYYNEDLFSTLPNTAYGTAGKIWWYIHYSFFSITSKRVGDYVSSYISAL